MEGATNAQAQDCEYIGVINTPEYTNLHRVLNSGAPLDERMKLIAELNIDLAASYNDATPNMNLFESVMYDYDGSDKIEVLGMLIKGFDINANRGPLSILDTLITRFQNLPMQLSMIKLLIDAGARARNLFHCINVNADITHEVIKILIDHIGVHTRANNGTTVLMDVCLWLPIEFVKYVIDLGADVNAVDNDQQTALHRCADDDRDNSEIMKLLIAHGADVNLQDNEKVTPLMLVVNNIPAPFINCVQVLLDAKADVYLKNNHTATALDIACSRVSRSGMIQVIDMLARSRAPDNRSNMLMAHTRTIVGIVRELITARKERDDAKNDLNNAIAAFASGYTMMNQSTSKSANE